MTARKKVLKFLIIVILAIFLLSTGLISVLYLGWTKNTTWTGDVLSWTTLSWNTSSTWTIDSWVIATKAVDTWISTIKTVNIWTVSPLIATTWTK